MHCRGRPLFQWFPRVVCLSPSWVQVSWQGRCFPKNAIFCSLAEFVLAAAGLVIFGGRLMASFGNPTRLQLWFLFSSIALEFVLFRFAMPRYRQAGERSARLASLFIVGVHFLPMAVAFGPMCFVLGVLLCFFSDASLWFRPGLSLNGLWAADGLLKMAFGLVMILAL